MNRVVSHLLFWIVILFWTSAIYDYNGKYGWHFVWFNAFRFPLVIAATYIVIYIFLPKWIIEKKEYLKFGVVLTLFLVAVTLLDRLLIGTPIIFNLLEGTNLTYRFFNEVPIVRNAFVLVSIIGLAALIRFFKLYLNQERKKHELQEAHLATQLAFLKAQVNPHFLFNALNNLYSTAIQKDQADLANGIAHLSGVMRYLTYESNVPFVPLVKEVQLIQDYIAIEQLHLDPMDDVTIAFNMEGEPKNHSIAPVILLPLVENAFKHGVHPQNKSLVLLNLVVKPESIQFKLKNTKFAASPRSLENSGIGIQNVQKRLDLVYPNQYHLTFHSDERFFITELQIQL